MDTKTITTGAVLLVVGLTAGYLLSGRPFSPVTTHMMPGGPMMAQNIDQHFIVQMIPHHEGAIRMAEVALQRSTRPEVLSLSRGIIEAQKKEIEDMRAWYAAWFGSAPPQGGMGMMHMGGMEGDVAELHSVSAADFDRAFLEQMIPHHEMAIMMAQMLLAATERAEMKGLGDNIITSQAREIEMMRSWLKSFAR